MGVGGEGGGTGTPKGLLLQGVIRKLGTRVPPENPTGMQTYLRRPRKEDNLL